MHELTREQARRIAVRAQLLDAARPVDLLGTVQHLGAVQYDVTAHVAQSQHLVLWTRLGGAYEPEALTTLLEQRVLIEHDMLIRPAEDMALHTAQMREHRADWVEANDRCRRDILKTLEADGPLPTRDLPDTIEVPWQSSGWTNDKSLRRLLDFLVARGEVALSRRRGKEPLWDLAERVYPDDDPVPAAEARIERDRIELQALGIARNLDAGEPATVEGTRGTWRVDPRYLDGPAFDGRAALLSPLDRLIYDRRRMEDIFGFDYQLEMYKPAGKRRWGYWAMPVLLGDRLVGKIDATADRRAGTLTINAIHQDSHWDRAATDAIDAELNNLAAWLGLRLVLAR